MTNRKSKKGVSKVLDTDSDAPKSAKFSIFWVPLLLIAAILGVVIKFLKCHLKFHGRVTLLIQAKGGPRPSAVRSLLEPESASKQVV